MCLCVCVFVCVCVGERERERERGVTQRRHVRDRERVWCPDYFAVTKANTLKPSCIRFLC